MGSTRVTVYYLPWNTVTVYYLPWNVMRVFYLPWNIVTVYYHPWNIIRVFHLPWNIMRVFYLPWNIVTVQYLPRNRHLPVIRELPGILTLSDKDNLISSRDTEQVFPVPASLHEDTFNLTIYKIPQPWEIESGMFEPDLCFTNTNTSQPRCSEHVITVVDRARTRKQISGNTEKMRCNSQPDRTKLKLHFKNPLYENLTETVV